MDDGRQYESSGPAEMPLPPAFASEFLSLFFLLHSILSVTVRLSLNCRLPLTATGSFSSPPSSLLQVSWLTSWGVLPRQPGRKEDPGAFFWELNVPTCVVAFELPD